MKRLSILLISIFITFSMCACGKKQDDKNASAPAKEAADTATKEETTPAPEGNPDDPQESAVVRLSFAATGNLSSVFIPDSDTALIQYGAIDNESGDYMYEEKLALYDLKNDKQTNEVTTKSGNKETIIGLNKDGNILTFDPINAGLYIYKPDLTSDKTVSLPEEAAYKDIYYNKQNETLFFANENTLYEYKPDGSLINSFSFDEGTEVTSFDPESGLLVYESADDTYGKKYTLYDIKTSSAIHTEGTDAEKYMFHDNSLIINSVRPIPDEKGESITDHKILSVYDKDFASSYALYIDDYKDFLFDNHSNYALASLITSGDPKAFNYTAKPVFFDLSSKKSASPEFENEEITGFSYDIFPETGKYLLATLTNPKEFTGNNEMKDIGLYIIDPALLSYEESLPSAEPDSEKTISEQYDVNLKILRNIADGIEKDYNVVLRFGDDVLDNYDADGFEQYNITSTTTKQDESSEVFAMLNKIRNDFVIYPEGFTDHFNNADNECRICISIVKDINSKTGLFKPDGFAEHIYDWYNIYIDTKQWRPENPTFHHEMWHTIEERLETDNLAVFDSGDWWPLNNPGFDGYVYSTENYGGMDNPFNEFLMDNGDIDFNKEAYFVRAYSTVNDKEDRATLIELLHNGSLGEDCFSSAEAMKEYPHLKAKLDFMADRMRPVFGTVYWEE